MKSSGPNAARTRANPVSGIIRTDNATSNGRYPMPFINFLLSVLKLIVPLTVLIITSSFNIARPFLYLDQMSTFAHPSD
jgi:hypothetical protein